MRKKNKHFFRWSLAISATVFLLLFFTLSSIIGLNSRRSEKAEQFVENLLHENTSHAFYLMSKDYKQEFKDNHQLFSYAAKSFIHFFHKKVNQNSNINKSLAENTPSTSFLAKGHFLLKTYLGQKITIKLYILDTGKKPVKFVKERLKFFFQPDLLEKTKRKFVVGLMKEKKGWKVTACSFEGMKLTLLSRKNIGGIMRTLSLEELLILGKIYEKIGDEKGAIQCYMNFYTRTHELSSKKRHALELLLKHFEETDNPLANQLRTELQKLKN